MDGWQIGLEYVQALAWPVVVVFFGWRLRAQAGRLLDRLVSLKTPAGSAEFDRQARDVSIEAQEAEAKEGARTEDMGQTGSEEPSDTTDDQAGEESGLSDENEAPADQPALPAEVLRALTSDEFEVFREVAAVDPAAAVMGTWRRVEQFMRLTLRGGHQIDQRPPDARWLLVQLQEIGLGPHFVRVAQELRRLRDSITHLGGADISVRGALDYVDAAERLADALVMLQAQRLD